MEFTKCDNIECHSTNVKSRYGQYKTAIGLDIVCMPYTETYCTDCKNIMLSPFDHMYEAVLRKMLRAYSNKLDEI